MDDELELCRVLVLDRGASTKRREESNKLSLARDNGPPY